MSIIRVIFDETDKYAVLCTKETALYFAVFEIMQYRHFGAAIFAAILTSLAVACVKLDVHSQEAPSAYISLPEVAQLLASLPLEQEHWAEVHDAALSSAGNGYDEEYRMKDLFEAPGTGVGAAQPTKADAYPHPLRDLLREALLATKAGEDSGAWLDSLSSSDVQIYWPYSEDWDGETPPVITYDKGDDSQQNEGWALRRDGSVQKVLVTEAMARQTPVWVVNRNTDAEYKSLEMRRREDPDWGNGGGTVLVKAGEAALSVADRSELRTLVLRSMKATRQWDSWLAGASEYWVKLGAVEDFTASTEAELRLYEPSITDFMIVIRRKQVGEEVPFNAVLVSDWFAGLSNVALMIVEDDGGTITSWKAGATVKWESKSYGVEVEIPLHSRDDIVWRGSLTRSFIERYSGVTSNFGDVELILELI